MNRKEVKRQIQREIEARRHELVELGQRLFSSPEPGFKEKKACAWLSQFLEGNGFEVERGCCRLPTAFRGQYGTGQPAIGLLAEYDALPGLGHGCGHNLIAIAALGAAIAAKAAVDQWGGRVVVIGTPAEEVGGGKVVMVKRGGFAELDVAMMVHPGTRDVAITHSLACLPLEVEFRGRAAHAAARPEAGINALEALLLSFQGINALRQHLPQGARVHGIITRGGDVANVVPAYTAGRFLVRAASVSYLEELKQKVLNCFEAAALATGARLSWRWGKHGYAPLRPNRCLGQAFAQNAEGLGRKMEEGRPGRGYGSTDMGNVSQVVPSIHPSIAIAPPHIHPHSEDFAQAACSPEGYEGMLLGALALAMTAADVLSTPELLTQIKAEFEEGQG